MATRSFWNISSPTGIKIHEILFVWCLVLLLWHWIFTNFFSDVVNVEYLQWVATAATIICISKHILARAKSNFIIFLGASLHRRNLMELVVVFIFSVLLGVGCWAVLVMFEANVNLESAFSRWGLISPANFAEIRWLPQWILVDMISGVVVVPITEEIIFRGFILGRLRQKHSATRAVIICSLIFAVFHLNKSFIGSFAHGIIFSVLAVRFSSLYAPMLIHGLYNAAVSILQMGFGTFLSVEKARISSAGYWLPELVCLAIGMVFLIIYLRHATAIQSQGQEPAATMV